MHRESPLPPFEKGGNRKPPFPKGVAANASGGIRGASFRAADHDLAEMSLGGHMIVRVPCFAELELPVDNGLETGLRYGAVHRFEHLAASHLDAVHAGTPGEDQRRVDAGLAREIADRVEPA